MSRVCGCYATFFPVKEKEEIKESGNRSTNSITFFIILHHRPKDVSVMATNLFPYTPHCEAVMLLERSCNPRYYKDDTDNTVSFLLLLLIFCFELHLNNLCNTTKENTIIGYQFNQLLSRSRLTSVIEDGTGSIHDTMLAP
ncbi:hypothetical protein Tco_0660307 [Tanacetum coccineum]